MRILTWNVNGLRSVFRKGFAEWIQEDQPDILCLQELKAQESDLTPNFLKPTGYQSYFNCAQKKGYSGVAIYSKKPLQIMNTKLGIERFDKEGRLLVADAGDFHLINLYLPHGGRQKENLAYKLQCYQALFRLLESYKAKPCLLIGDFNIAHLEVDVARFKQNYNNIMFTPEERKQIDQIIALGFKDTLRLFHLESGYYTWWAYIGDSRARNLGWRIDYLFASAELAGRVKEGFTLPDVLGSDHCPAGIELK